MITTIIGLALIIAGPVIVASFLAGTWHGRRLARWERHVDGIWDASASPVEEAQPQTVVYAADDDDEWLAGIKARTDAFIALLSTE